MARPGTANKGTADVRPQLTMTEQHLSGDILWIGFRRHGDGRYTRFQGVTQDGRWVAVEHEPNDGIASFVRDFKAQVGKLLQVSMNPLKRK